MGLLVLMGLENNFNGGLRRSIEEFWRNLIIIL
jgi:hypothetical protein